MSGETESTGEAVPMVSILIPVWNRKAFVAEAVRSVFGQTFSNWECIVIDDGSTDGSADAVRSGFSDPRLVVLRREHGGISAALNHGLRHAAGEWVARLDSDDAWHPEYLQSQLELACAHPEAVAVYARAEAADARLVGKGDFRGVPQPFPGNSLNSLLLGDFTCNITVMAGRASVAEAGGWDPGLSHSEDWDLWLRVARRGNFIFNPRCLARYREHADNITRIQWSEFPDIRTAVLDKHFSDPDLPGSARVLRGAAYRRHLVNAAMMARVEGNPDAAARRLREAYRKGDGLVRVSLYALMQYVAWVLAPRLPPVRAAQRLLLRWRDRVRRGRRREN